MSKPGFSRNATADGVIEAGARKVQFIFSEDFAGEITVGAGPDAMAFDGATDYGAPFEAAQGFMLPAITYTISAGSARIWGV